MTQEQLQNQIETVCQEFHGQAPDLLQVIGIVTVGRLFGWRVLRLVVSPRLWTLTIRLFGDPKQWMPERGRLAYKSKGLKVLDTMGGYWDFIQGITPRDGLPNLERRMFN